MKRNILILLVVVSILIIFSTLIFTSETKDAVESLKQAIRINPDDADAHYNLGVAYGNLGLYKDAIEAYKQAIRIDPDNAAAHCNLGEVYLLIGDRNSALNEYKILKDLDIDLANKLFDLINK